MKHNRTLIIVLLIIACSAPQAFGDVYYGLGTGINFLADFFPDDSYSRQQICATGIWTFQFFPKNHLMGLYTGISLGSPALLWEQNARESMKARKSNIFELKAVASPSFKLQSGPKFQIPLSLGPTFIFTNENTSERIYTSGVSYSGADSKLYNYKSVNGGINGDIAFLINPTERFFLRPGISFDYIFLRAENGQMRMNYRTTHNEKFKSVPYSAFNISIYFGLGVSFSGKSADS